MNLKIKKEFSELIPPLTRREDNLLENNNLSFKGFNGDHNKFLAILPSEIGNLYWFVSLMNIKENIHDYTKQPIALSRIKNTVSFVNWNEKYLLKPLKEKPYPIDYFEFKKTTKEKRKTNVYFIQSIVGGAVKIGKAENVEERLKQHQTGCPFKLKIIKVIENVEHKHEKELHKKFKDYLLHGEWYNEEILNQI